MNDRFRFRVWGIQRKKWENKKVVEDARIGFLPKVSSNYVVEQCTGLKDKNGRLIYEGDILALPYQAGWRPILGVVKFDKKQACFLLAKNEKDKVYQSFWWSKGKEVIGNIHENGDLLEDK